MGFLTSSFTVTSSDFLRENIPSLAFFFCTRDIFFGQAAILPRIQFTSLEIIPVHYLAPLAPALYFTGDNKSGSFAGRIVSPQRSIHWRYLLAMLMDAEMALYSWRTCP